MNIRFNLYVSDGGARALRNALMDAACRAEERAQTRDFPEDHELMELCHDLDMMAGHISRAIDEAAEEQREREAALAVTMAKVSP